MTNVTVELRLTGRIVTIDLDTYLDMPLDLVDHPTTFIRRCREHGITHRYDSIIQLARDIAADALEVLETPCRLGDVQ